MTLSDREKLVAAVVALWYQRGKATVGWPTFKDRQELAELAVDAVLAEQSRLKRLELWGEEASR